MSKSTNKPQRQFYRDIQKWIKEGCPEHRIFLPTIGICSNYADWCIFYNRTKYNMGDQFIKKGYHSAAYPFNSTLTDFLGEQNKYTNPKRLNWIKFHANH